jgi:DNA-binding response OmpR family regulator
LAGFEVECRYSGRQAIDLLQAGTLPGAMLLDLHMVDVSGGDVYNEMVGMHWRGRLALFTADGAAAATLVADGRVPIDEVLVKPVTFRTLRRLAVRWFADWERGA